MEHGIMVLDEDMNESALMSNSYQNFDSLSRSWTQQSTPQDNLVDALHTLPDLGLKLSKTQSFLDKLDQIVQEQNSNAGEYAYSNSATKSKDILQQANKMKAENFPISLLSIGSWQRVSINEGDLVAKCYFAKRKLVWEFLENGLKSKIEIQWSDILSLKAVMQEDQTGILEIELNQPPSFHHEIDPQPRKHTQWRMVSDFTGGQAPTFRRHHLEFPPGALDRPLEKLLRYDSRLFHLSQQGYPTLKSPYFQRHTFEIDFSFDVLGQGHINPEQQFSLSNVPPHYPSQHFQTYAQKSFHLKDSDSPISVMDFSHIDEHMINNQMPLWDQGNQVGGMSLAANSTSQVNSTISLQNNLMSAYVQDAMKNQLGGLVRRPSISHVHPSVERHQPRFQIHSQNILNNSQTEFSNGIESNLCRHPTNNSNNMTTTTNEIESNLCRHPTNNSNNLTTTTSYGQNMIDNVVVMSNNLSSSIDKLIYPQADSLPQSQVFHENMSMNLLTGNNLFYSSINSDPTMEYFSNFDYEINEW